MATPIDLQTLSSSQGVARLASLWPNANNAQALAVLEAVTQWVDASAAAAAGLPSTFAESFLAPDGILPRMRLLACGWTKPGDSFRRPDDASWWRQPYKFPLWAPLATYADALDKTGDHAVNIDADVASGDIAALSQSLTQTVDDLKPVLEAPCPKWTIPPGRGQMPVPNPECIRKELDKNKDKIRKELDKVPRPSPSTGSSGIGMLVLLIAIGYLVGRKRRT